MYATRFESRTTTTSTTTTPWPVYSLQKKLHKVGPSIPCHDISFRKEISEEKARLLPRIKRKKERKKREERNCTPYEEEEKSSGLCALFLCPRILSHLLLFPRSSLTQGLSLPPRRSSSSPTSPHYVTLSTPVHICRAISRTTAPRSNPLFPPHTSAALAR